MRSKAETDRDNFYNFLLENYGKWDINDLTNIITEKENALREEYKLKAMGR